jgi:hypothetical protein
VAAQLQTGWPFPCSDPWACADVAKAYYALKEERVSERAVGNALRAAGARKLGKQVKINGCPEDLFSIRNHDDWAAIMAIWGGNRAEIRKEYLKGKPSKPKVEVIGETQDSNKVDEASVSENDANDETGDITVPKAKFEG